MSFCFILASISGREHLLRAFIESAKNSKYKDCDFYLYFQNTGGSDPEFDMSFFRGIMWSETRDGCCMPRMKLLEKYDSYDYWVILDDDVELRGEEDFEAIMRFLRAVPDAGICVGDYANNSKNFELKRQKKRNVFEVKNVSFIEGGAVISKEIRELLLKYVPMARLTHDGYAITSYVNGYTNYKYFGSLVLHKATNGVNGFVYVKRHDSEFVPFYEDYIQITHYEHNGELRLPQNEGDLTEWSRQLHVINKEARHGRKEIKT